MLDHHRMRTTRHFDEAVGGDIHRVLEVLARGIENSPGQLGLVRIGNRVDEEVDPAPAFLQGGKGGVERGIVGNIDVDHKIGTHALRERLEPLAEGVALIGEGEFGPRLRTRLGDAPRDRAFVSHAHHEPALSCQHTHRHITLPMGAPRRAAPYPWNFDSTIDPLVPPNPKELVITESRPAFSTSSVAISSGLSAGSSVSTLIDGMMKSCSSASRQ